MYFYFIYVPSLIYYFRYFQLLYYYYIYIYISLLLNIYIEPSNSTDIATSSKINLKILDYDTKN